MIQYVGVKFMNNGPHSQMTSGVVYNYKADTNVLGKAPVENDIVICETQYGPSVAYIEQLYTYAPCNATCSVLTILPDCTFVQTHREAMYLKQRNERIRQLRSRINEIVNSTSKKLLVDILAGKKVKVNSELAACLEELEELGGTL